MQLASPRSATSILIGALLCAATTGVGAQSKTYTKTHTTSLACPATNPGCKDEKCNFENQTDVTADGTEISAVAVKWRKTSTSQCCKGDRSGGNGGITLTYTDGSVAQITTDPKSREQKGISWLDPKGNEVSSAEDIEKSGAMRDPAGFTFDKAKAKMGLKEIIIHYTMRLTCSCIAGGKATQGEWMTDARFKVGDEDITVKQKP